MQRRQASKLRVIRFKLATDKRSLQVVVKIRTIQFGLTSSQFAFRRSIRTHLFCAANTGKNSSKNMCTSTSTYCVLAACCTIFPSTMQCLVDVQIKQEIIFIHIVLKKTAYRHMYADSTAFFAMFSLWHCH